MNIGDPKFDFSDLIDFDIKLPPNRKYAVYGDYLKVIDAPILIIYPIKTRENPKINENNEGFYKNIKTKDLPETVIGWGYGFYKDNNKNYDNDDEFQAEYLANYTQLHLFDPEEEQDEDESYDS